jgi:hypothetical protein
LKGISEPFQGHTVPRSVSRGAVPVGAKRRKGESLIQLLTRLDQAIAKANNEGVFTDEINSPMDSTRR